MTGKYWVFTLNNPLHAKLAMPDGGTYLVWQLESGKQGTVHLQGYVEFAKNKTLAGCKKWLPSAHWEQRRGTAVQARDYCQKEESRVDGPWELGQMSSPEHLMQRTHDPRRPRRCRSAICSCPLPHHAHMGQTMQRGRPCHESDPDYQHRRDVLQQPGKQGTLCHPIPIPGNTDPARWIRHRSHW